MLEELKSVVKKYAPGGVIVDAGCGEGYYSAMIVVNEDEENSFDGGFEVYSPIIINQEPVYIGTDDEDSIILVEAEIPSDIDDAIIIIKINGTEEFRKSVSDFVKAGMSTTPEDLTWHYLHRYGDEVTDYKVYRITTINIGREFTQGIYNFDVSLVIDEETFSRQDNVAMAEINSVSKDGCTIEIYDASEFYSRDDEMKIIAVYAPEGTSGKVKLTIEEDDEWLWENSFEDGTNIYPCDLGLAAGTYHITVAVYDEDDNQVINNTGVITLNYGEDGFMGSDVRSHMDYDDRWGIRIWFAINDISGRLVIKFDDVTYYDEHVDSSNYDEYDDESGQGYILFSAKQLGINPGNYDVAEISYYGDDGVKSSSWVMVEVVKPKIKTISSESNFKGVNVKMKLSTHNGKPLASKWVKVKFNGKTYKVKTSKKGVLTFKKSLKLKIKKYTMKINYNGASLTKKIKVKLLNKFGYAPGKGKA